ncbi:hypothetical protein POTOM_059670 [Populus tomentosa]|uniref:Uncharacterized protein n=1 Tax=Populus tomentosa TaxID=118781 RepID=A0A8X8BWN5_POPTO|nr:hypothetical protein POTOM_059670 [Populus tomentosa]
MEGNLGKEDSNSAKDLQEKKGSGHKRRGSAQPSPSGVKKTKKEIDRDHREKRKGEMIELKKGNKILQESNWRFLGQMDQMKMELRERGEEIISLRIKLDRHDNSLRELEEKLIASGEEKMTALKDEHAQEIHAINQKHEQEMLERNTQINAILEQNREMKAMLERIQYTNALAINVEHAQNNSMETPTIAQDNNYSDHVNFPSFYD